MRGLINAVNVGKPLGGALNLFSIKEFTVERNPMNAVNVARLLIKAQTLFDITGFIVAKSPMNVMNVESYSPNCHTSLYIIELTQE